MRLGCESAASRSYSYIREAAGVWGKTEKFSKFARLPPGTHRSAPPRTDSE